MEHMQNVASSPDPLHQVDIVFKRPLAYPKMESLVKEMQDEETGVPVRSQKLFLSSIPAAFAGYDIIEWLMERLTIEDSAEAIHIANLLCQHGYFFPVGANANPNLSISVRDDSSLYRFQTPYYWPNRTSFSPADTSVDYAIYLSKRTLRNKQKHGLEDYEVVAYNDLKRNMGHKWDFVMMQAEEQVRLNKERKKYDRLVLDSQERAYWRVLRPPPGIPSCIENPPTFQTQSIRQAVRKPNQLQLEDLRKEVELLRNSCTRTRIKCSKALESLASYSESYAEHDPFLTPRQPSNPWHTDDPTFWVLNADLTEVPSERRLKKWGISLEDLINDPSGCREFTAYLKKEYCHENIRFWCAVRDMRYGPMCQLREKAQDIYDEFLSPGSPCEINIDMRTMEAVQKELNFLVPSRFTFDPAAEHVYIMLLKKDCYPRFIRSDHYKGLLEQARQLNLKSGQKRLDKFFSFVAERKKKTSGTDDQRLKASDSSSQHTVSGLTDNVPYRGDFDNNKQTLTTQDSLDDVCCPWETSSSVKSDRTTSTDRLHRIDHSKQLSLTSDKSTKIVKQKSAEEKGGGKKENRKSKELKGKLPSKKKSKEEDEWSEPSRSPKEIKKQLSKQGSSGSKKSQDAGEKIPGSPIMAPGFAPAIAIAIVDTTEPKVKKEPSEEIDEPQPSTSAACQQSLQEEQQQQQQPPPVPALLHDIHRKVSLPGEDEKVEDVITEEEVEEDTKIPFMDAEAEEVKLPEIESVSVLEETGNVTFPIPTKAVEEIEEKQGADEKSEERPKDRIVGEAVRVHVTVTEKETTDEERKEKAKLQRKKSTTSSSSNEVVCPWDCENGTAPESSTFTKTYSTLGYL